LPKAHNYAPGEGNHTVKDNHNHNVNIEWISYQKRKDKESDQNTEEYKPFFLIIRYGQVSPSV
jgi:hypothetical protein